MLVDQEEGGTVVGPRGAWFAALGCTALIIYGSLFPFSGWSAPRSGAGGLLVALWPRHVSRADLVTNLIIYVPVGLTWGWVLGRSKGFAALSVPVFIGALLSGSVEFLQAFLPARNPSLVDLAANVAGTAVGSAAARAFRGEGLAVQRMRLLRTEWVQPGREGDAGLAALGLWAFSQLSPLVPSLDIGNLRQGLSPLWNTLRDPGRLDLWQSAAYGLALAGLGVMIRWLVPRARSAPVALVGLAGTVLLFKIPVVGRQLSAEAVVGLAAAAAAVGLLHRLPERGGAAVGALLVTASFLVDGLRGEARGGLPAAMTALNWVPFRSHLANPITGIADLVGDTWWAAALAWCASRSARGRTGHFAGALGGFTVFALALGVEWAQTAIPGRSPDVTDALVPGFAWGLTWRYLTRVSAGGSGGRPPRRTQGACCVALLAVLTPRSAAVAQDRSPAGSAEPPLDEAILPTFPRPEDLPAVHLPGFRRAHPRLPAPSLQDIERLGRENPEFFRQKERLLSAGRASPETIALLELARPGSQDLTALHARLMALTFTWRGHEQGEPLAVAYDWLFDRWTEAQRAQLREKLAEGCDYLIERIRKERLSPYNVYLYNRPLQALMACTLVLFGDDARGDRAMRFTHDYWKNRVLPVWRQVMGRNGGWHEGGEYVGIGIGQAIYQLPSMWRAATGEDLFASEPGIRGFLDFLVYRTRPDGAHLHKGDGRHFDRSVPDRLPLALEYGHAAAYTLGRPPKRLEAVGWPWGPLTDATLLKPDAHASLPLSRLFDGIGLLVARSDWTAEATYVTFQAGDNYWSHSHLDQGGFSIYRGGALAIDSGLYGPQYGSDHHMNYAYQTIAHNTVTVTDPSDTVPAPGRNEPRRIANDGGQRRIGSGWGVEAAPLDLAEWTRKRDIYHTGSLERMFDEDGLVVAVADITPAYTNNASGKGNFSHRTRRVETLWRTFGYDRNDGVVVVFDRVRATHDSFRKRWLLHTLDAPRVGPADFTVKVPAGKGPGRAGGRLEGRVLLPERARVEALGGAAAFLVDGVNYDEEGKVFAEWQARPELEVGAWRIEVSPEHPREEDLFLVVLLPAAESAPPSHGVSLLRDAQRVGCEIRGPRRTTRWWFDGERNGVQIGVEEGGSVRQHDVRVSASSPPAKNGGVP